MRRAAALVGSAAAAVLAARVAVEVAEGPARRARTGRRDLAGAGGGAPGLLARGGGRARPGAAQVAPPSWEPRALTALAGWVPDAPHGRWRRAAAYAWAAPLTLGGLLAGASSLAPPRACDGVLLFSPARGPAGGFLRLRGFTALTLGHVVVSRREPSPGLLAHELVHVRQAERLGPLMAPLYLALLGVYGYARHPLERAARIAQRRHGPGAR